MERKHLSRDRIQSRVEEYSISSGMKENKSNARSGTVEIFAVAIFGGKGGKNG